MKPKIQNETPMMFAELKEELEKIHSRDGELNFRAQKTFEYLQQVPVLEVKKAKELFDKIMKLNVGRLKEQHVAKIIDVLPTDPNDLKLVLQHYNLTISQESLKKIAELVAEYKPKE